MSILEMVFALVQSLVRNRAELAAGHQCQRRPTVGVSARLARGRVTCVEIVARSLD